LAVWRSELWWCRRTAEESADCLVCTNSPASSRRFCLISMPRITLPDGLCATKTTTQSRTHEYVRSVSSAAFAVATAVPGCSRSYAIPATHASNAARLGKPIANSMTRSTVPIARWRTPRFCWRGVATQRHSGERWEELPEELREVIVMREPGGMDCKEIAEMAGVPLGTVMSRLARARKRLQQTLTAVPLKESPK